MKRPVLSVAAFTWLLAWGAEAFAAEPGDAAAGRRLAQRWCGECHQMDGKPGRVESHIEAPNFVEIAKEPSITPLSLRVYFQSNHENMPNLHISATEADNLVAYILSLKQK
jgi:mono/diheme cytochrome c family protein